MTTTVRIGEREVGFGRVEAEDARDEAYPMRALFADAAPARTSRYWWQGYPRPIDQGATGTCVGHGLYRLLVAGPTTQRDVPPPFTLYRECVLVDEWTQNDREATGPDSLLDFGTSVRAAMRVATARGYVSEYRWAWDGDTAVRAVLDVGPVVIGVSWTEGMMLPDAEGLIHATGRSLGGHCVTVTGANTERGIVRIDNSWGRWRGRHGHAYLPIEDLDRLIREGGEAAIGVETARAA